MAGLPGDSIVSSNRIEVGPIEGALLGISLGWSDGVPDAWIVCCSVGGSSDSAVVELTTVVWFPVVQFFPSISVEATVGLPVDSTVSSNGIVVGSDEGALLCKSLGWFELRVGAALLSADGVIDGV